MIRYQFAHRATQRQLALFGFPPPGHPYWTEATLAGTAQRYPKLNMTAWQSRRCAAKRDLAKT
jgi:hypothetical protein